MTVFLAITAYCASAIVLWATICSLNFMSSKTPLSTRLAYVLCGVGALSVILGGVYHQAPGVGSAAMAVALAALLVTERLHTRKLIRRYQPDGSLDHLCGPWWT